VLQGFHRPHSIKYLKNTGPKKHLKFLLIGFYIFLEFTFSCKFLC